MEVFTNSKISREYQFLFLGSSNIVGVQSVNLGPQLGLNPLKYIGMGNNPAIFYPNSDPIGNVTIDSLFINNDPFINYTGDILVNGYIVRSPSSYINNYSFLSGFLTSYNCRYQNNQIPVISTTFGIANDLGNLNYTQLTPSQQIEVNNINNNGSAFTGNYLIPNQGSIILNINDFQTNRVQSYDISININKVPVYNMGQKYPSRIQLISPLDITCSFTFEIGNYQFLNKANFPQYIKNNNLNLQIYSMYSGQLLTSYNFNNLNLVDESYGINLDGNLTSTVTYKTLF